jgi:short-subunit dehydrogenase
MYFKDKVVWITGASSGIGEAMARAFANQGAKLVISARREEELNRVKRDLGLADERCMVLPFDVVQYDQAEAKVAEIMQYFGRIDVLMNNAGVSSRGFTVDNTMEAYKKIFELNVFSVIAITKAVLPMMIAQKSGHITVTSSVAGKVGTPMRSSYAATKHAMHGFFDSLRAEVWQDNIDVTIICPGYIKTNISLNALAASGEKYGKMDENQEKGMAPEVCAEKILKGMAAKKLELYIGGREVMGIYLKRFFPKLLAKIVRRVNLKTLEQ